MIIGLTGDLGLSRGTVSPHLGLVLPGQEPAGPGLERTLEGLWHKVDKMGSSSWELSAGRSSLVSKFKMHVIHPCMNIQNHI